MEFYTKRAVSACTHTFAHSINNVNHTGAQCTTSMF